MNLHVAERRQALGMSLEGATEITGRRGVVLQSETCRQGWRMLGLSGSEG